MYLCEKGRDIGRGNDCIRVGRQGNAGGFASLPQAPSVSAMPVDAWMGAMGAGAAGRLVGA